MPWGEEESARRAAGRTPLPSTGLSAGCIWHSRRQGCRGRAVRRARSAADGRAERPTPRADDSSRKSATMQATGGGRAGSSRGRSPLSSPACGDREGAGGRGPARRRLACLAFSPGLRGRSRPVFRLGVAGRGLSERRRRSGQQRQDGLPEVRRQRRPGGDKAGQIGVLSAGASTGANGGAPAPEVLTGKGLRSGFVRLWI